MGQVKYLKVDVHLSVIYWVADCVGFTVRWGGWEYEDDLMISVLKGFLIQINIGVNITS